MTRSVSFVECTLDRLVSRSPWFKAVLYLHVTAIAIWAPILGVATIGGAGFALLLLSRRREFIGNAKWISIFCVFAVGIAVPWGTAAEVLQASEFAVRMLTVMTSTRIVTACSSPKDLLRIAHDLSLSHSMRFLLVALFRYLETAVVLFSGVMLAQRSRGLRFGGRNLFRAEGYRALAVPYSLAIVRSIDTFWISMNMRPCVDGVGSTTEGSVGEVVTLVSSVAFWFMS